MRTIDLHDERLARLERLVLLLEVALYGSSLTERVAIDDSAKAEWFKDIQARVEAHALFLPEGSCKSLQERSERGVAW